MEVIKMKLNVIRIFENGDGKDQKEDILTEREQETGTRFGRNASFIAQSKEISHIFLLVTETRKMCNAW